MLVSPTLNETTVSDDPRWVSPDVYPYTLLMYGQEEGKLAARLKTDFVDMGTLYGQTMGLGRVDAGTAFALAAMACIRSRKGKPSSPTICCAAWRPTDCSPRWRSTRMPAKC